MHPMKRIGALKIIPRNDDINPFICSISWVVLVNSDELETF